MVKGGFVLQFWKLGQDRQAAFLLTEENEGYIGMTLECLGGSGDDDFGTEVSTHDVDRNSDHLDLTLLHRWPAIFSAKIPLFHRQTTHPQTQMGDDQSFFQSFKTANGEGFLSSSALLSIWPEKATPSFFG